MKDGWQSIAKSPARAAALAVRGYQIVISPAVHAITGSTGGCRFYPTCSEYARQALLKHGLAKGSLLSAKRLSKCHPFQGTLARKIRPIAHDQPYQALSRVSKLE